MDNLFNVDVGSIFEQYSIKEIEALNLKIQHEVDGKKEELRNMVKFYIYCMITAIYILN